MTTDQIVSTTSITNDQNSSESSTSKLSRSVSVPVLPALDRLMSESRERVRRVSITPEEHIYFIEEEKA